jgi:hypothetical protein
MGGLGGQAHFGAADGQNGASFFSILFLSERWNFVNTAMTKCSDSDKTV